MQPTNLHPTTLPIQQSTYLLYSPYNRALVWCDRVCHGANIYNLPTYNPTCPTNPTNPSNYLPTHPKNLKPILLCGGIAFVVLKSVVRLHLPVRHCALCCSVMQRVAACCSVLQRVAERQMQSQSVRLHLPVRLYYAVRSICH